MRELAYTSLLLIIMLRFSHSEEKENLLNNQKVRKYYEHNVGRHIFPLLMYNTSKAQLKMNLIFQKI